ncbi:DUF4433 domain-containing protein [Lacisediminihabitans profunda]|uniref:DUF4433 domain-containing protein n=1 Tax=Lacisediminihabitans profunda TaxID=2594790 RepID=A0A5C8UUH0_9MICO|nr:DUF4433 domain-containing protein [Lacisediminihabitans profunda]TXN31961.1 DUF4433 domain-containing protein [Lacisediminihabitans profunda]
MADECIHGLDAGLCDQCYPKPAPEVEVVVSTGTRTPTRPKLSSRAAPRRTLTPRRLSTTPLDDVGEQRIYHVTHMNNLGGILGSGILSDLSEAWESRPVVDISSADARESRRSTLVAGSEGPSVAHYVPFVLSPNASIWQSIRTGVADPRLSAEIAHTAPSDFVLLVTTVKKIVDSEAESAVTDGDAAHVLTRFGSTPEAAERMLRRLRADEDSILHAEYLVRDTVPFELVTLIGVANDKARDAVKAILKASPTKPKVAVYPPWFQPVDEGAV